MKIRKIEPIIVSIPLKKPKKISTRPLLSREYLIVKITTENGIIGWGVTFGGFDAKIIIDNELTPLLLGEDPNYVESLWEKMFNKTLRWGRRGIYIRAISALDIALWDINCKSCGVPLYRMLGAYRKLIPAYASGGYYKLDKNISEVQAISNEMQKYVDDGFSAAKMKVGGLDIELDIERICVARKILGEKRKLYIDVNNGWKLYQLNPRILNTLEEIGVDWIEEPFLPDAIEETKKLRERTSIPIANGEILTTRWDFKQILESNSCDIWQPDVTVLGGITEWKKIITMASIWNIPVAPHAMHEIHTQLAASLPDPQSFVLEYFDTTGDIVNYGKLLKKPLKHKNGFLYVTEEPGVGMEFDEQKVNDYKINSCI